MQQRLSKLILFGEKSLRHALREYVVYYHHERNHQGKENLLLFPVLARYAAVSPASGPLGWPRFRRPHGPVSGPLPYLA